MKNLRNLSIRTKATIMIVLASSAILIAALSALLTKDYLVFRDDQLEQLTTLTKVVVANSTAAVAFDDREAAQEGLNTLTTTPSIVAAIIWSKDQVLASYRRKNEIQQTDLTPILRDTGLPNGAIMGDLGFMYARQPIVLDGETIGTMVVASDLSRLYLRVHEYILIGLGVLGSAIVVALLVSMQLGSAISRPLSKLTGAMRVIENEKDYTQRVAKSSGAEVGQLIDSFNAMLEQIESRDRQLSAHGSELERQVQLRTQELVQTNASLWQAVNDLEVAKRKAEEANHAKSEFLATVSHEIRTPLNGVLGTTEILLNTDLSDKQRRFGQIIHGSAKALLGIINNILDFSKIEAGKVELESLAFSPREIVEEVQELFLDIAQKKGLGFGANLAPHLPRRVTGDPGRLRQILTNLVGNAMKFTEKGEITIHAKPETIGPDKIMLRFEVRDTGIGIPMSARKRIFESFAQADQSTTRRYGGTGLGLTIAKQIVELMGGAIGVESDQGVGSTFWFTVQVAGAAEDDVGDTKRQMMNAIRALVVCDDGTARESFVAQVASLGLSVLGVENDEAALALLRGQAAERRPFDLVFIDLRSPEAGGRLAREIGADNALQSVRIVILDSVLSDGSDQAGGVAASDRLLKPVRQSNLYDCLSRTIRDKSSVQSAALTSDTSTVALRARVLLAEDNPVNREVAGEALRQLGCGVDFAHDGNEAVEMWSQRQYDIILMDCHMPNLDGLEATTAIRNREWTSGDNHPIPIIALTANARGEDYQRCLAIGMNDYLTKPLTLIELRSTLEKWLSAAGSGRAGVTAETRQVENEGGDMTDPMMAVDAVPKPAEIGDVLDMETIEYLKQLRKGDGPTVLEKAIGMYLENAPNALDELRQRLAEGDATAVWKIAHGLKGSSASLGAKQLAQRIGEFEGRARASDLSDADSRLASIESEYRRVSTALQDTLREEREKCRQTA
jgi:signal transduction histidine kinase/CheY-like chemotaxis protein/HPt (histidine-containing phosphotransfer) domain-containing protein